MRAVALHADVIVFISRIWQTTCTAVRAGEEGLLIDSPVYPDELDALPDVLEQAGFPVAGLLVTHADWDHLLGRLAFPDATLGCGESTASRLRAEPGGAQRELRRFDEENYVERRPALALAGVQALPIPGRLSLGADRELELHPAEGHTSDGIAISIPWAGIIVCGDYLSPVEIPVLADDGSIEAYLDTLKRLRPLLAQVETVVPGHGSPLTGAEARQVLSEDESYLTELVRQASSVPLPPERHSAAQERIHKQNLARARGVHRGSVATPRPS